MAALGHIRRCLNRLRALRDRRDGVAMVEFGLVALPFFFLLFVILETGYFFLLSILLEGAAAEGARQVRTGVVQQAPTLELALDDLKTRVCDKVYMIGCGDLIFDVRNFPDFPSVSSTPPPATQGEATFAPGTAGSTVVVRVIYKWTFITPFIEGVVDTKQMIATVAFRNEPY